MPQGKLKVKAKLPTGVKTKAIAKKREAHFQKKNRPALPKKTHDLREAITKSINEHIETSAKEMANLEGKTMKVIKKTAGPPPPSAPSTSKSKK